MVHWTWLIMAFLGGFFVGVGSVFIPLMLKGLRKLEKK